jgi:hypothetical protein
MGLEPTTDVLQSGSRPSLGFKPNEYCRETLSP